MTTADPLAPPPGTCALLPPHTEMAPGAQSRGLWTVRWEPAIPSRACLFLIHGHSEHIGRYDRVETALTKAGHIVHSLDHHGQGRSQRRGAACRRFDDAETDLDRIHARALSTDKTLRLWPDGRYEPHNDLDQGDVIAATIARLDERVDER